MAAATKSRKQTEKTERTPVSIDKMRDKLGAYVNEAAVEGKRFVISRHGLPAAALVSIADLERIEGSAA